MHSLSSGCVSDMVLAACVDDSENAIIVTRSRSLVRKDDDCWYAESVVLSVSLAEPG